MSSSGTDSLDDLSSLVGQDLSPAEQQAAIERKVRWHAVRLFLMTSGVLMLCAALVLLLSRPGNEAFGGFLPPAACALLGGLSLLSLWKLPRQHGGAVVAILLALVIGVATLIAVSRGVGLYSLAMAVGGLIAAFATGMLGLRIGMALTGMGLAAILGLGWAEYQGWATSVTALQPLGTRLATHTLLLFTGLLVGVATDRMVKRSTKAASDRSARFRGLLSMAADWYWEMNRDYRFTHLAEDKAGSSGLDLQARLGKTPWEVDQIGLNDEDMDAHRADLESHRPFNGMVARRRALDGSVRYVSISGEPRFDTAGNFRGYWGVGRDVTSEVQAEQAIHATETRYRELFRRSPSPLVLHRWGRVLDANPAAMAMFGYTQRSSMIGQDLFSHYEPGDDERARQRAAKIEAMPVGGMLPMAEFRLRTLSRRHRLVQATSVRVDAASGPGHPVLLHRPDRAVACPGRPAPQRGLALASGGHQPRCHHPDRDRFRPLRHGQQDLRATQRLQQRRGAGAQLRRVGHLEEPRRTRAHAGPDPHAGPGVRTAGDLCLQERRGHFHADVGGAVCARWPAVPGHQRPRCDRDRAHAPGAPGHPGERLDRHHTDARAAFRASQPPGRDHVRLAPGGLVGQHGSVVWPNAEDYAAIGRELGPRLALGEQVETERPMRRRDGTTFLCRLLARAVDLNHPSRGGTIWIMEDVTERRRVEAALAQAKDEAQAANRAKSAFLANTSHEIRTPLNGLLGLARMLQQPDLPEATRRQYLDQMLDSAESLSGLISDILDLSKIEAGRLTLEAAPFALRDMLATMRMAYLTLAHAHGLAFKIDVAPEIPAWVVGDQVRIRQILSNYLSNALKFTESGSVAVRVMALAGERVRIEVSDTGPGIAPELHERLFEAFTQADESTTRRYGGTGLGLSICRELATLMGGEVGVLSAPGQGSTFWAELPLPAAATPISSQPREARDNQDLQGLRVLMVEDHPVNMMIAVAQLQQWGLEVSQANDGSQAVEAIFAAASMGRPFDAVLMDVQMPVMSGHEATRQVRQRFDAEELPIVALTAAALVSERDEALAAGMNEFLTKPIDAPKLRATLVRLIGHKDNDQTRS